MIETKYRNYHVDDNGNVWSTKKHNGTFIRKLKTFVDGGGYLVVALQTDDKKEIKRKVHLLVCESFHGERPQWAQCVRHIDGNKKNNKASNLCWGTRQQNEADKILHGTKVFGSKQWCSKLKENDILEIDKLYLQGLSRVEIANIYGVHYMTIHDALTRKKWKHIPRECTSVEVKP